MMHRKKLLLQNNHDNRSYSDPQIEKMYLDKVRVEQMKYSEGILIEKIINEI